MNPWSTAVLRLAASKAQALSPNGMTEDLVSLPPKVAGLEAYGVAVRVGLWMALAPHTEDAGVGPDLLFSVGVPYNPLKNPKRARFLFLGYPWA